MASPTWCTWVWVNFGSWWWTGRPGMLRFMGSQSVGHDWVTELNWIEWIKAQRREESSLAGADEYKHPVEKQLSQGSGLREISQVGKSEEESSRWEFQVLRVVPVCGWYLLSYPLGRADRGVWARTSLLKDGALMDILRRHSADRVIIYLPEHLSK